MLNGASSVHAGIHHAAVRDWHRSHGLAVDDRAALEADGGPVAGGEAAAYGLAAAGDVPVVDDALESDGEAAVGGVIGFGDGAEADAASTERVCWQQRLRSGPRAPGRSGIMILGKLSISLVCSIKFNIIKYELTRLQHHLQILIYRGVDEFNI